MRRLAALLFAIGASTPALADSATLLGQPIIKSDSGAVLYQHICQGCHMPGGRGAIGAAAFPALAGNKKLAEAGYPVGMVLNGNGGMPWFNGVLTDAQIADVVNYVRTHFGNNYADGVTPADVTAAKGPAPTMER